MGSVCSFDSSLAFTVRDHLLHHQQQWAVLAVDLDHPGEQQSLQQHSDGEYLRRGERHGRWHVAARELGRFQADDEDFYRERLVATAQVQDERGDAQDVTHHVGHVEDVLEERLDTGDQDEVDAVRQLHECPHDQAIVTRPEGLVAKDWQVAGCEDQDQVEGDGTCLVQPVAESRRVVDEAVLL
eukprot:6136846-Prymnesium_polylepis.1